MTFVFEFIAKKNFDQKGKKGEFWQFFIPIFIGHLRVLPENYIKINKNYIFQGKILEKPCCFDQKGGSSLVTVRL